MISDESAAQLHDQASRGGVLAPEQRAQLDAWLAAQDEAEAALLSSRREVPAMAELRAQVNAALEQLGVLTRNIRELTAQNEALRRDLDALRDRLAARPISQPA